MLELSVASVNSVLQRANDDALETAGSPDGLGEGDHPSDEERAVLQRFMDAHDRANVAVFAALLREDVRQSMPPYPFWYAGQ